jgi:hypothetical protein
MLNLAAAGLGQLFALQTQALQAPHDSRQTVHGP